MVIGERIRAIREQREISQGDIERSTGLLRCYISRVENCHTTPSIETLEKIARSLDIPMYALFYEGEEPPKEIVKIKDDKAWGNSGKDAHTLVRFRRLLSRTSAADQKLLLAMATKMATRQKRS